MSKENSNIDDSVVFTKKKFSITIAVILLVILLGFWGVYYFASNNSSTNTEETPSQTKETVEIEKVQRSISGESLEDDKKNALNSAQAILEASAISPDDKSIQERVEALDQGDDSVVDSSLTEKMRFVGEFEDDKELQYTTYQALITLSSYTNANGKIEPISDTVWQQVHVDQEAGIAYVPISAFYGPGASFSLELVYTDGEWKMAPYSLLDIINLSALLQQQSMNQE